MVEKSTVYRVAMQREAINIFSEDQRKKFTELGSLRKHRSFLGFPSGSDGKESVCNVGDAGSIPGSGRSPGERNGYPLQYSCLENPMDGGARWATVHGVAKSQI